jgi:hypothetical protein
VAIGIASAIYPRPSSVNQENFAIGDSAAGTDVSSEHEMSIPEAELE